MTVEFTPTAGIATSTVNLGFAVDGMAPLPWRGRQMMQPLFVELSYLNDHDGQGWRWHADVRGRRINQGGRLGAFDAQIWFTSHSRRLEAVPAEVRELAETNTPGAPEVPQSHRDPRRGMVELARHGEPRTGTWVGRVPVREQVVHLGGHQVSLEAVDPQDCGRFGMSHGMGRRSIVEFVPDGDAAGR